MDKYQVSDGMLVATSAARDAENGAEFLAECERVTGLPVALLSGAEEAAASYRGATSDLPDDPRTTVIIDIGGGSTELAFYVDDELVAFSMQLGCVRVSEAHLGRETISADARQRAVLMIRAEIDRMIASEPRFLSLIGGVRMVGLAGTVATLAQMDTGTATYDRDIVHHHVMSRDTVRQWSDRLAAEPAEARLSHPGMVPGREDVLVGGLLILEEVMSRFAIDELLSSECDILDGVASMVRERRNVT
jgi:exopolyphosphatase/guanosine-5'-triphosphate,3'-diphosphate pyrophosphatase